jgi:peptidoglycan hydrolase-like protein with peptidoglycan-binding domain
MRIVAAVLLPVLAALPAVAQIDNPAPRPQPKATAQPAAKKRPPEPKAPRTAALPLADRIAIQYDLAWAGDYDGIIDGEFSDRTIAAIKTFQGGRKLKETGVLKTEERALLAAASRARQRQVGWIMIDDPVTGAQLGIPTKQVPNTTPGRTGTKWSSAQGQVQIETFRVREPGTTLASVYEQQKKDPPTRRIGLNFQRPHLFVMSGTQGLKRFSVRAEFKDGEVRGMTVLYDQATEPTMGPVAIAMTGAFTGFPGTASAAHIGSPTKRKVEYGTGIIVSAAGHILTNRRVTDGCSVIVVGNHGNADRQAEDAAADLALLRVHGASALVPAGFGVETSGELTLVGIAEPQSQDGGRAVSTMTARLRGDRLEPSPQLGFSGAGALDQRGRFVGMVELKAGAEAGTAQPLASLVPASTIRAFLAGQKLDPAPDRTGVDAAKASLVRIICVRK